MTPARSSGRRRWILVAGGLGLAGLTVVTAVVAFSSKDSSASHALTTATACTPISAIRGSTLSISVSSSMMMPGSHPESRLVGGRTDHIAFAWLVAQALLAYDPSTDFGARNEDSLRARAPAPSGDEARRRIWRR